MSKVYIVGIALIAVYYFAAFKMLDSKIRHHQQVSYEKTLKLG